MGPQKILGPKLGLKFFWVKTNFRSKKILGPKNFKFKKVLGPNKFGSKMLSPKNFRSKKYIGSEKILSLEKILVGRKFCAWSGGGGETLWGSRGTRKFIPNAIRYLNHGTTNRLICRTY